MGKNLSEQLVLTSWRALDEQTSQGVERIQVSMGHSHLRECRQSRHRWIGPGKNLSEGHSQS